MEKLRASSILISLACILVLTVLVKAVNWLWLRPKKLERWLKQQGIPGNSYRFLLGDMKDYTSMLSQARETPLTGIPDDILPRVDPLRHQLVAKFGRDYFLWFGPTPMVNISKPELIREALTRMHEFQKPRFGPIADKLFPGLVQYEGEKWEKHRKMITPAFNLEKLKIMLPAFYDSCSEMISEWEKIFAETGSSELDVWPYLTTLTADVISRAAFGSSYKEGHRIFELLKEQTDLTVKMLQSVYIPGLRYIPTARNRRFKEVEDQIQTSLKQIVNKRKAELETGSAAKADLLGILMNSTLNEIQQTAGNRKKQQPALSTQEVIDECKLFYFAGQETTSVLLVWTLILLSKHQDWQARAREEVLQTFSNHAPNFEGLNHLKIVTMIMYEVLRLYPPVTQLTRKIHKDIKLGELLLPAGALISFPILHHHHDTEFWGQNAKEFRPDRFTEGISKAIGVNNMFIPFGGGPRICIGERFAMTEAKMVITMILQRFSFELSPSYVHAPMPVLFLQPQHGAQIIFHRLSCT